MQINYSNFVSSLCRIQGGCFCVRHRHCRSSPYDNGSLFQREHLQLWLWSHSEEHESSFSTGGGIITKSVEIFFKSFFLLQQAWKWGGCSADITYGMKFSRKFLDVREVEADTRSLMNLQNNKVGRKVNRNNLNYFSILEMIQLTPLTDSEAPTSNRLQVSRCIGFLCDEDVLEDSSSVSDYRRHAHAEVQ